MRDFSDIFPKSKSDQIIPHIHIFFSVSFGRCQIDIINDIYFFFFLKYEEGPRTCGREARAAESALVTWVFWALTTLAGISGLEIKYQKIIMD